MSSTSETPIDPNHPMIEEILETKNKVTALDTAIQILLSSGYAATTSVIMDVRDEYQQKLKDLQIDANALPFPEK